MSTSNEKPKSKLGFTAYTLTKRILNLVPFHHKSETALVPTKQPAQDSKPTLTTRQQRRTATISGHRHIKRQQAQQARLRKRRLKFLLGGALTLLSVAAGIVQLYGYASSRVSVAPAIVVRPDNPFATTFTVTNDGFLSLNDLQFSCAYNSVKTVTGIEFTQSRGDMAEFNVPLLRPDEKTTTICYFLGRNPVQANLGMIQTADIAILVSYHPSFIFGSKEESFRFISTRQSDGTYQWLPMAAR